jgi:hypothetical protein
MARLKGDGLNFTERQRIKRKAQRWAAKFAALSRVEQIAVLNAIGFEGSQPAMFRTKSAYERQLGEICGCGHTWADHDNQEDDVCNGIDLFGCACDCNGFHAQSQSPLSMVVPGLKERLQRKYLSSPMPDSGATKLSPRESAEPGGLGCS